MTTVTETVIATPDPPPQGRVRNPIHDEDGAAAAGYAGALVAGVRTYGWAANVITRALGESWLSSGWVDFTLKRPLYAGEAMVTTLAGDGNGSDIECTAGEDHRIVLAGSAGLGTAPWYDELDPPTPAPGQSTPDQLPGYDLDTVPLQQPLIPLAAFVTSDNATAMVEGDLGLDNVHYRGEAPRPIHPYFLAARIAPLTRHNFSYGPTIHVRSQIQHLREARADRTITVGARIVDAYDRNDHWYQVLDGVVTDDDGELCRIRHHTIFRPRGT